MWWDDINTEAAFSHKSRSVLSTSDFPGHCYLIPLGKFGDSPELFLVRKMAWWGGLKFPLATSRRLPEKTLQRKAMANFCFSLSLKAPCWDAISQLWLHSICIHSMLASKAVQKGHLQSSRYLEMLRAYANTGLSLFEVLVPFLIILFPVSSTRQPLFSHWTSAKDIHFQIVLL